MHGTFRSTVAAIVVSTVIACGGSSRAVELAPSPGATAITVDELRRDLIVFSADSFGGRATATPYAEKAARFLTARLQSLGVEPGGDSGRYLQRVPLKRNTLTASELSVSGASAPRQLTLGQDLLVLTSLGPGALPRLTADAEIAFASYGIQDTTARRNDFAGLDVAGKVLAFVAGAPPNADSVTKARYGSVQSAFTRMGGLIQRGPAAIVVLVEDSIFTMAQGQFSSQQLELAGGPSAPANVQRAFPMVAIARVTSGSPFVPPDWPTNDRSRILPSRFIARLSEKVDTVVTHNVIGIVRGSDPARRNTYVAFGAHYDHVGTQPPTPTNRDTVFNGADDDGSGSVGLLAIARAWAQGGGPKPPRSGLFVWHIGEELGLFGSAWFTAHPTVPIDSIVAQINADMIGRNNPDSLYIVGPGAAPNGQSRVLGQVVDSVNAQQAKPFAFNREWDTLTHPERIYYRSDHFNYATKGIPIVFFTTGLHPQYHQLDDEAGLIDYAKLARVSSLMSDVGMALARRTTRPK
jgi:hypothetical protein